MMIKAASGPEAKVIILTTFGRDDYVFQGIRAGAMGFLLKDTPADNLLETILRVHEGEAFIQPEIASRALLISRRSRFTIPPQANPTRQATLSPETEVISLTSRLS